MNINYIVAWLICGMVASCVNNFVLGMRGNAPSRNAQDIAWLLLGPIAMFPALIIFSYALGSARQK